MAFRDDHRVYDALRTHIIRGQLGGGTHLYPDELADSLSSSSVPVREALIRLSERGLVDYKKGKGFSVARPSLKDQIDAIELAKYLYSKDILSIQGLPLLGEKIERYVSFVDNVVASGHLSEEKLSATCLREFQVLFLPPISTFVLQKLYDLGFFVVRVWTEHNEDRAIHAVLHGRDLIEGRRFVELEAMVCRNMEDMIQTVKLQL